ncbi:MAG: CinA family protein [Betaproteobacteria bacterium]|nr:CinA family protein [Betaproteobacteria bacterium]
MPHDTLSTLATLAGARLKASGLMLASAESCTGGWISMAVTEVAGSSEWFDRGFVTYSNEAKEEVLGVARATLDAHGAVSEATAREMALGTINRSRAQIAVAVTGVAGPGGGTEAKPVGTVCIAWAGPGAKLHCETRRFEGDREQVRRKTVIAALQGIIELLEENK